MSIKPIKSLALLAAAGLMAGCVSSGYGYREGGYGHGGYYTGQASRHYGGYSGGVGYGYPGGVYGYGGYRYSWPSGYYGGVYTGYPYRYGYYGGYRGPYYGTYPGYGYYRPPVVIRPHPRYDRDHDRVRERPQHREWRRLEGLRNNNTLTLPQVRPAISQPRAGGGAVQQRAPIRSLERIRAPATPRTSPSSNAERLRLSQPQATRPSSSRANSGNSRVNVRERAPRQLSQP